MDFGDLKKRDLNQKIRKLKNKKERWEIWKSMQWISFEGNLYHLNQIGGIEYKGHIENNNGLENFDCVSYAIGDAGLEDIIPGILEHNGNPEAGDLIIYGHGFTRNRALRRPTHTGVWQEDGTVVSKWGDNGPVMKHEWNKVIPDFGKYAFFSKYKGIIRDT